MLSMLGRALAHRRAAVWLLAVGGIAGVVAGSYLYVRTFSHTSAFRTAPVARGPLAAAVSATGTLNAVITVQVGSQVSGQIKTLYVDFNSPVQKGQIIARIDPEMFEAQVRQARAQLEAAQAMVVNQRAVIDKARADVENARAALQSAHAQTAKSDVVVVDARRTLGRQHELKVQGLVAQADEDAAQVAYDSAVAQYDANVAQEEAQSAALVSANHALTVAQAQLDNAVAQVAQNEANLRQAELSLDYTVIRAPVNGVVVARSVDVGQTVAASLSAPVLFLIAQDLTKMQVDANVAEADVGRLQEGQRAAFTVDAFPNRVFAGRILQVRKAAQVLQNVVTYDVVVSADNPDLLLLPSMTANLRIVTDQRESALQVPNAALRFRPAGADLERPVRAAGGSGGAGGRSGSDPGHERDRVQRGRVWVLDADGKPRAVLVRLGISDGTNTEVIGDGLAEREAVIVGLAGPGDRAGTRQGGGRTGF